MKDLRDKKPQAAAAPPAPATGLARFSREDRVCALIVLGVILIVYTIRSKFLGIPFERDEGIYSYFGKLLLEGGIPYKDFYEAKFPGLYYFYALIVLLFGDTVEGMHSGFMWVNILTLVLVYLAARKLFSPAAGVVAAITFAFVSLTPNLSGFTVQSEHGVALFIALGIWLYALASSTRKLYLYLLMGVAMGLAFMVKTSGVFLALWGGLVIITDFLFNKPWVWKTLLWRVLAYSAGGLSMIALFFGIIYIQGAFADMLFFTYELPKIYISNMPLEEGMKYFNYTRDAILQNHKLFWYHALAAVAVCLVKPVSWRMRAFGITLLAFSFMTIVPGFYFYGHYWIQTVPGLAVAAGLTFYCVDLIVRERLKMKAGSLRLIYVAIFIVGTLSHISKNRAYYFHPNYDLILRQVYGNNPFPEAMEIARYINEHSRPEDNIVVIGSEPQIYFYTQKKAPSRHAYFTAVVNNIPPHKQWQREFSEGTEKAKPRYFVFFNHPLSLLVQPGSDNYIFEWANKYITENYKLVGLVDMVDGLRSTYVWGEQVNTYKPVAQSYIYIFERNK